MPIVPDKSGNNPGNPVTNGWSGVDQHNKTIDEMQRDYYAAGGTTDFTANFLAVNDAPEARHYLGTDDAASITTGVLDPARIPVITSAIQVVSTASDVTGLSPAEQAQVVRGCVVTTTDGSRWLYSGSGSKVLQASYILLADVTPDWSVIANRPSPATSVAALANGSSGTVGTATDYARSDHAHVFPLANINAQTGTTYTLQASDHGKIIELNNAASITLTLDKTLPIGFNCMIMQVAAGQVTISPQAGATMRNRQSYTKTAGQWAEVSIRVRTNAGGSAAEFIVSGDMA